MCEAKWLAIILVTVLLIILLFRSKRSNFVFSNADYQYSNPSKINEYGYYKCIFEECRGDAKNYDCLERCKYKQFHSSDPNDFEGIRDRMCDLPKEKKWKCLNNIYKNYGYNV